MRRRKVYLMVGVGIFSIIAGNRIYQKSLIEGNGYLGDEVVFFAASNAYCLFDFFRFLRKIILKRLFRLR